MKRKLFSLFAAIVFVATLFTLPASAAIVQDIPTEHQQGKVLICEYTREAGVSADFNAILQFRAEAASGNVAWPIFVSVKSDCIMGSTGSGSLNEKLCTLDPDTKYEVIVLLANTTTTGYRCHYRVYVNGVCITKNKWTSPVDVIETSTGGSYDTMKWTKIDYKCPFAFVGALNSIDQFDEDAYKAFITGSSDSAVAITSSDSGFDGFNIIIDGSNGSKTVSELKPSKDFKLDKNGIPVKYKKKITGTASAYSCGTHTATGKRVKPGYIAVNPRQIPYGTKLFIRSSDGSYVYGYASAEDTGGFVKWGNTVADLFFWSESACNQFGRRGIEIYVLD